jgi:CRISPR-associated exonuclease Cas4
MEEYLPLSYINQFAYCPRRFWYMYVQGEMIENAHVVRALLNHERVDTPGRERDERGVLTHRRVYVFSERLGVSGICDLVEEGPDGTLRPVEYKQGKQGRWTNDQAQLCAQALCLEEMTGRDVPQGEIFYFGSRRRVEVTFDAALRAATEAILQSMRAALARGELPPHTDQRRRCQGCSLQPICLPQETEQLQHDDALSD